MHYNKKIAYCGKLQSMATDCDGCLADAASAGCSQWLTEL